MMESQRFSVGIIWNLVGFFSESRAVYTPLRKSASSTIKRGLGTERARLGTFRGFGTERARLGTFRGFGTERARLGTFNHMRTKIRFILGLLLLFQKTKKNQEK